MKKAITSMIIFILLLTTGAFAESFNGRVIAVVDANNILVANAQGAVRVRFAGVECPECDQMFGMQAKQYVTDMVMGKEIWVDVKGVDHDKRLLSVVVAGGKNVGIELLETGFAWFDPKFQSFKLFAEAEKRAKSLQIGLWACSESTHPRFHRQQRSGIIPMAGAPCHTGSGNYGLIEASTPADYTDYGSCGSPGGYYYNYYNPYYYNNFFNSYRPPLNNNCQSTVNAAPTSVVDSSYIKSQHSVTDTSYMQGQHSVTDRH